LLDGDEGWVSATEETDLAEELPRLRQFITQLSAQEQEVLRLTFVERLTLEEIAERIEPGSGGSVNARRLRMMRMRDVAIERLRGYFNAER
jgi:RNA polymerase sigma factor (sigma-70 family)